MIHLLKYLERKVLVSTIYYKMYKKIEMNKWMDKWIFDKANTEKC